MKKDRKQDFIVFSDVEQSTTLHVVTDSGVCNVGYFTREKSHCVPSKHKQISLISK
jgi:hypothetical protein